MRFLRVKAPTKGELTRLTHTIAQRVGRYLERQGLLERDTGNIYLTQEAVDVSDEDPSNQSLGRSITYRIADRRPSNYSEDTRSSGCNSDSNRSKPAAGTQGTACNGVVCLRE